MRKIKLVLTDIDGTLVRYHEHAPTAAVRASIEELKKNGVKITAATGRPCEMARELFLDVGLEGLNIFDAGATIRVAETGEIAWKNWLSAERLRDLTEIFIPYAHEIDYSQAHNQLLAKDVVLSDISQDAPYAWACVSNNVREKLLENLEQVPDISVHIDNGMKKYPDSCNVQITDINADKFHAVQALKDIAHSNKDETLAIGDSSNDLPLFSNSGLKIAMGNATEALKEAADYVVGDVESDGFADAMNRFVFHYS